MSTSVLDTAVLDELYEIMDDDFVSILVSYLENAPDLMRGIQSSVQHSDLQALVTSAHSLKSSSANVGAMELSILSRELEFKGRQKDNSDLATLYDQLASTYQRTRSELEKIVERGSIR